MVNNLADQLVAGVLVGLVTIGVLVAVTSVPFLSTRLTVTGSGVPTNCLSGVKAMEPSGLIGSAPHGTDSRRASSIGTARHPLELLWRPFFKELAPVCEDCIQTTVGK